MEQVGARRSSPVEWGAWASVLCSQVAGAVMRFLFFILTAIASVAHAQIPLQYPHKMKDTEPVRIADKELFERLMDTNRTVFYKLPQMWQRFNGHKDAFEWGVYSVDIDREMHANFDFPWEGTVGLNTLIRQGDTSVDTINFISLPVSNGKPLPIVVLNKVPYVWIFPAGTMAGEIIYTRHEGKWWPQELRARIKDSLSVIWEPLILRPVANRQEFAAIALGAADYTPAKKWFHFRNPEENLVFEMEGFVERLPEVSPEVTKKMLRMYFKDVTYERWSDVSIAPSSDQAFGLFPKDYSFGLIEPEPTNCAGCHRQTQVSVASLIPREPLVTRSGSRIGNIRGSDGIFTWHPFGEGTDIKKQGGKLLLRKHDIDKGFVVVYTSGQSEPLDPNVYKLTEYVEREMQTLALPYEETLRHGR